MATLKNRAGVGTTTTGTGTISLGAALGAVGPNIATWQSFADAGVADGDSVRYLILDQNGAWEYGPGTYNTAGTTLTRPAGAMNGTVPGQKSSTGALLSLSGSAQVFITAVAEDIVNAANGVTVSGTPAAGQWARWVSAGTIEGVLAANTGFVLKTGDTMTGSLTISQDWGVLRLNCSVGSAGIISGTKSNVNRWNMYFGDHGAESGSNAGSNFAIERFNDAGTSLGFPLTITRSTGLATVIGDPTAALGIATKQYVDSADALKVAKAGDIMTGHLQVVPSPSVDGVVVSGATSQGRLTAIGASANVGLLLSSKGAGATYIYGNNYAGAVASFALAPGGNTSIGLVGGVGNTQIVNNPAGNPIGFGSVVNLAANSTAPTPASTSNDTTLATTAFIKAVSGLRPISFKTATYNVVAADRETIFQVSGTTVSSVVGWNLGHTVTAAQAGAGFRYTIRNVGNATILIDPAGAEVINGESTLKCLAKEEFDVVCDGTNWFTIGRKTSVILGAAAAVSVAAVTFTIPPDYKKLKISGQFLAGSNGAALGAQVATDGVPNFIGTGYYSQVMYAVGTSVAASPTLNGAIWFVSNGSVSIQGESSFEMNLWPDPGWIASNRGGAYTSIARNTYTGDGGQLVSELGGFLVTTARFTHILFRQHDSLTMASFDYMIEGIRA